MSTDSIVKLMLFCLPTIAVIFLGIIASGDVRTREQWTNFLYQAGSIKPEQRSDPKIQRGVRIPFFIVAVLMLIWPVRFYFHATRTLEIGQGSDIFKKSTNIAPGGAMAGGMPAAAPGGVAPGQMAPSGAAPAPGMMQPGAAPPGMAQPGTVQPGVGQPGAMPPNAPPAPAPATGGPHL